MKKILLTLISASLWSLLLVNIAAATDIVAVLWSIVDWLIIILIIVAVIFIIVGGYLFVSSIGEPDKIKKAKQTVLYALVGLAVGLLAEVAVNKIQDIVQ